MQHRLSAINSVALRERTLRFTLLCNTAWLVGRLMFIHGLTITDVKQHFDFNGKNCPYELRKAPGKWQNFLALCQAEYDKAAVPVGERYHRVQVGAWKTQSLAEAYAALLRRVRIDGELVQAVIRNYEGFWRVQVGAWSYESLAKTFANKLQQVKIDGKNVQTAIKYY